MSHIHGLRIGIFGILEQESGGANVAGNLTYSELLKSAAITDQFIYFRHHNANPGLRLFQRIRNHVALNQIFIYLFSKLKIVIYSKAEKLMINESIDIAFFLSPSHEPAYFKKIPVVSTFWDVGHRDLKYFPETGAHGLFEKREVFYKQTILKSIFVLTDSLQTSHTLSKSYGMKFSEFVDLPFAPMKNSNEETVERQDFIFYPANFWKHKNHKILLLAMSSVLSRGESPRKLILTGQDQGYLKTVEKLINELGLERFVEIRGFVSDWELARLYSTAKIVAMPSLLGPTNLPPLEALLRSTPVFASRESVSGLSPNFPITKLDAFDVAGWSEIFDCNFSPKYPDIELVQAEISTIRASNCSKLSLILDYVRHRYVD